MYLEYYRIAMLQSLKETIKMRKFNWHIVHADIATGTRYSHIPSQDHLYLEKKKNQKKLPYLDEDIPFMERGWLS